MWLGDAIGGGSDVLADDEEAAPHGDDGVEVGTCVVEGAEKALAETEIWCCALCSCDCAVWSCALACCSFTSRPLFWDCNWSI